MLGDVPAKRRTRHDSSPPKMVFPEAVLKTVSLADVDGRTLSIPGVDTRVRRDVGLEQLATAVPWTGVHRTPERATFHVRSVRGVAAQVLRTAFRANTNPASASSLGPANRSPSSTDERTACDGPAISAAQPPSLASETMAARWPRRTRDSPENSYLTAPARWAIWTARVLSAGRVQASPARRPTDGLTASASRSNAGSRLGRSRQSPRRSRATAAAISASTPRTRPSSGPTSAVAGAGSHRGSRTGDRSASAADLLSTSRDADRGRSLRPRSARKPTHVADDRIRPLNDRWRATGLARGRRTNPTRRKLFVLASQWPSTTPMANRMRERLRGGLTASMRSRPRDPRVICDGDTRPLVCATASRLSACRDSDRRHCGGVPRVSKPV
jgi:hypothetical protein